MSSERPICLDFRSHTSTCQVKGFVSAYELLRSTSLTAVTNMSGTNAYVEVASICYIWQIRSHSVAGFFLGAFLVVAAASVQIFDLKLNEASQAGAESGGMEWVIPGVAPARLRQRCSLRNTEHTVYSKCTSDRTLTAPLLPHARFEAMAAVVFKSLNYTGSSKVFSLR